MKLRNYNVFRLIRNFNIRKRLLIGFGAICIIPVIATVITMSQLNFINDHMNRIDHLRVPTSTASSALVKNIYASLAALRGWMLTGDEIYKTQRSVTWKEIDQLQNEMDILSENWTNPENIEKWSDFKITLDEFRKAQTMVEKSANSPEQFPANVILIKEAVPSGDIMFKKITEMIDIEAELPSTSERKRLLGIMADIRGTLGLGLANIRAYLLTGETSFKDKYEKLWAKNERRFNDLNRAASLLNHKQISAFDIFSTQRAIFKGLPSKMFAIRSSEKWNNANYLLVKEAAPRANILLAILGGNKGEEGMVKNQTLLLSNDILEVFTHSKNLMNILWLLMVIGIVAVGSIVLIVANSITKPITAMTNSMSLLAEGDTSVSIPGLERKDEIGEMASSVNVFKNNALHNLQLEKETNEARIQQEVRKQRRAEEEKTATQKRLDEEETREKAAQAKRMAERMEMAQTFEDRVSGVLDTVASAAEELNATSHSMNHSAGSMKNESVSASTATTQAGHNVQLVAGAAEEMSVSVREISSQISHASKASKNALKSVDDASQRVAQMATSSNKINEIIQLINDIAEQTNLLALNATIEAARAGEAGKGFAVVASEVKSLANQTATATEDIRNQINEMQETTDSTVTAVETISITIKELDDISSSIAESMAEQALAMQEISRNSLEAANSTGAAGTNVTNVSQLAEETGNAASEVLNASNDLSKQASSLKEAVDEFLHDIRTG